MMSACASWRVLARLCAGIEASTPVGNFTIGQATRYIIAGISAESAGDNCTIWVGEGVQCGGQVRRGML